MAYWVAKLARRMPIQTVYPLIFVLLLMIIIGIVAVESAGYPVTSVPTGAGAFYYFLRHLVALGLGLVVLIGVQLVGERRLPILGAGFYVASVIGMIAAAVTGGYQGNAAWTPRFGPIPPCQPSEVAKVSFVILAAWVLGRKPIKSLLQREVGIFFALAAVIVGLLLWQRDIGMLMLFTMIVMMMLALCGLPVVQWAAVVGAGAVGAAVLLPAAKYRMDRIYAWLRPQDYIEAGPGRHILNSLIAVSRGAGRGLGLARSTEKWTCLPYPHSDSVFCVWASETGLWGTGLLLLAVGWLAVLSYTAASRSRSRTQWLLAMGCGLTICVHALVHMAVATNLVPQAGLTLPFVSYGGTSVIASALAAAIVLWVARRGKPAPVSPMLN